MLTVIQAGPCLVVQKKTTEKDGYDAVQIGLVEKVSNRRITSAVRGHFEKAGVQPVKTLAEVPYSGDANVGDRVQVDIFNPGDSIDVVGQSKGKGYQGVVRRHGFAGGRESHGSMFHRAPGSIGASSFPSRVVKGMRMAGHMGADRVTTRNIKVLRVDAENNLLLVEGSVPGGPNSVVVIRKAVAAKVVKTPQVETTKKKGRK